MAGAEQVMTHVRAFGKARNESNPAVESPRADGSVRRNDGTACVLRGGLFHGNDEPETYGSHGAHKEMQTCLLALAIAVTLRTGSNFLIH